MNFRDIALAIASLVLGAGVFLLALHFFWLADRTQGGEVSLSPTIHPGMVVVGTGNAQNGRLRVTLNGNGQALIRLPLAGHALQDIAFLHLSLPFIPDNGAVGVLWQGPNGERLSVPINELNTPDSWLYMGGLNGWQGGSPHLDVLLGGPPMGYYDVAAVSLSSFTLTGALKSLRSDWTVFSPWKATSINSYWPGRLVMLFQYPVAVVALLLACSVAAYLLLLALLPGSRPFRATVPVALFLFYWILVDLGWQAKLFRQVELSHQLFAAKNSHEKLIAGPDSRLYEFTQSVNGLVQTSEKPRIFVSTSHDFIGMRVSYYLYPNNVYWERRGSELPAPALLRKGDFIVLLNPTRIQFDSENGMLYLPDNERVKVETVMQQPVGSLLRVI